MTSKRYKVESTGNWLFVTITRRRDGASVFLQGDEAETFMDQIDDTSVFQLDDVCSEYDDVMQAA